MKARARPLVRYHGGKWMLAPWIISHFPPHSFYTEAFGGGGSVLLRKTRSYSEVYNDLDREIVNLFRITRDRGAELAQALYLTAFSREDFLESYRPAEDPLEQARRTVTRAFQGFGSAAVCGEVSGFRAKSNRSGTTPAHDWRNYPDVLAFTVERLRGVVIENRNALDIITSHDTPETLHYVDPPYVHSTRSVKIRNTATQKAYKYEMTDEQHRHLASVLKGLQGMVVLSGYPSKLYTELYSTWHLTERESRIEGAKVRIECLWLNDAAFSRSRTISDML